MDALAAVITHEELSAADPAFCLSYLAHSMLFVNNLNQVGKEGNLHKSWLEGSKEGIRNKWCGLLPSSHLVCLFFFFPPTS